MDRPIPSGIVEQWMTYLRLLRSRANDQIWLIEMGTTLHEHSEGVPMHDATQRWLSEQKQTVADVNRLLALYESINTPAGAAPEAAS